MHRPYPESPGLALRQITGARAARHAAQATQTVNAERAQNILLQGRLADAGRMLHLLRRVDPGVAQALPSLIRRCSLADAAPFRNLLAGAGGGVCTAVQQGRWRYRWRQGAGRAAG